MNQTISNRQPIDRSSPSQGVQELSAMILSSTYTRNQMRKRLRLLKDFINFRLFQSQKETNFLSTIGDFLERYPLYKLEAHWISTLGENFFKQFTDYNTSNLLKEITKYLDSLPTPVVFLPFQLSDDLVYETKAGDKQLPTQLMVEVGAWFKKNVSKTFIFDPQYNPDLVGGCAISVNGVYKDFSLRTRIEESHERILEILKEAGK